MNIIDKYILKRAAKLNGRKPLGSEDFKYQFTDSSGMKYYYSPDYVHYHVTRMEFLLIKLMENQARMTKEEIDVLMSELEKGYTNVLIKGETVDMARIGAIIHEYKFRINNIGVYNPVMLDVLAAFYIREDEFPYAPYDDDIHLQKVDQFLKDQNILARFFFTPELLKFIGMQDYSEKELISFMEMTGKEINERNKILGFPQSKKGSFLTEKIGENI